MDKFPLTKVGYIALEEELKHLKGVDRPNIIAAIAEARSHGDLSENKVSLRGASKTWRLF